MSPREPLSCPSKLTSKQTTWNGVRFQYYVKYPHETDEHSMRDHLVSIPCSKPFILDWKIENRFESNQIDSGDILFCRLFKKSTGMTPHRYIIQQRIEKAKILLIQNKLTIADIAQLCGFSNQSHFSATFRRFTGVTPRSFRQQHLT